MIGRFAPSPTGPLHFGSLVAAVASYLDARALGGRWLVRIEDIDTPRNVPGAADDILRTLERFGLTWDGPVLYQSSRMDAYREALEKLRCAGYAYPCSCSRREVGDGIYPGTCRDRSPDLSKPHAWRVRVEDVTVGFDDRLAGRFEQNLKSDVGDFVILRADGIFAYQLAVVVDDASQGVTDIVRGADLLDSTPRQIWLQRLLGYPQPRYMHFPIATDAQGEKLSKQTLAPPLAPARTEEDLRAALRFLGQPEPPHDVQILPWAKRNFSSACILRVSGAQAFWTSDSGATKKDPVESQAGET
jgi:glutamyl-Q tRNA(Asp) synthetase